MLLSGIRTFPAIRSKSRFRFCIPALLDVYAVYAELQIHAFPRDAMAMLDVNVTWAAILERLSKGHVEALEGLAGITKGLERVLH